MKKIDVRKRKGLAAPGTAWVKRVIAAALRHEKVRRYELSVYLTDNPEIRRINRRYLKHDYATDVLSFWVDETDPARVTAGVLGDLVVSVQTARDFAKDLKIPFKEELARYLVHGTLHLLGYDDHKPADHKEMHKRQEWLLKKIL